MSYSQLTHEERYEIKTYMQAGFKFSEITKDLDVHKSTIYRDISCNRGLQGYRPRPHQADKRKRLSLREEERIEAFVGGLESWQRLDYLQGLKDALPLCGMGCHPAKRERKADLDGHLLIG